MHVQAHGFSVTGVCKQPTLGTDGQILLQNRFNALQNTDENEIHNIQGLQESRVTSTQEHVKVTINPRLTPTILELKNGSNVQDRKFFSLKSVENKLETSLNRDLHTSG